MTPRCNPVAIAATIDSQNAGNTEEQIVAKSSVN
jgi:hypothetical protein